MIRKMQPEQEKIMDEFGRYRLPAAIRVSREDNHTILGVKYNYRGTARQARQMYRWILQFHGLEDLAEFIPE